MALEEEEEAAPVQFFLDKIRWWKRRRQKPRQVYIRLACSITDGNHSRR